MNTLSLPDEVELIMWAAGQLNGQQVYECQTCGAIVLGRYTHVEWHREQDEAQ